MKKMLIFVIMALFCMPLMAQAEMVQFPTSADIWNVQNGGNDWYQSGDNVSGDRSLALSNFQHAYVSLYLSSNSLDGTGHVNLNFLINGTIVGTMTILPTHETGYVNFPINFTPIDSGAVTIQYYETNTVDPGRGAIHIDPKLSTIDFLTREAVQVQFPTSADIWNVQNGGNDWYQSGDNVSGDRSLTLSNFNHANVSLYLSYNSLNGTGHVDLNFLINGTIVGTMTILPTHGAGYANFPINFTPIDGGIVTLQYYETNTVDLGRGAIHIDPNLSTIDFLETKKFPWAMFLPAIMKL